MAKGKFEKAPALGSTPPPPRAHGHDDAHGVLWQRLDALTIATEDKVCVAAYLGHAENEGMRGFLAAASDKTFETWVYQFISKNNGH
jgi:hypothetical protein